MKKLFVAAALALGTLTPLAVTGCAALNEPPLLESTLTDERALYAATSAYKGVLLGINEAIDEGLIKPGSETALFIDKKRQLADKVLDFALQAKKVGDTAGMTQRAFELLGLVADIRQAIGK